MGRMWVNTDGNVKKFSVLRQLVGLLTALFCLCTIPAVPVRAENNQELANMIHKAADSWQSQDFDRMLPLIDIEGGRQTDGFLQFLDKTIASIDNFNGVPGTQASRDAFRKKILAELDERRFAQVDDLLREAARKYPQLEAAVRTGSSGLRHLGTNAEGNYRPLLSDDDITFVGEGAVEAKSWFNSQIRARGLGGLKVKGFTLNDSGKFSPLDKAVLDLLDPEKFVGQAAMSGIRSETMKKGAVVLGKGPDGQLEFMRASLADYLKNTKSMKSALDAIIEDAARRYGPLTMIASVERQIVGAHQGWGNLTPSEQIKYVLRSRKKVGEGLGGLSDGTIEILEQMSTKFSKFPPPEPTADEAAFLLRQRKDNLVQGFKAANDRIMALADREAGTNLAANPEVRAAVNELATGFAMLKDLGAKPEFAGMIDADGMIAELIDRAQGNPELKKILYTANKQAEDMLAVLAEWSKREDDFAKMLEKLPKMTQAQRAKTIQDRQQLLENKAKAGTIKQTEQKELQLLSEVSSKSASSEGDALLVSMIKSPAGKKVLVALALTGGGVTFAKMYDRWKDGGYYNDLSSAAASLVDFLPGAMSFERLKQDGYLSPGVAYQFAKEAMSLTWLWPVALAGDIGEMTYDAAQALSLQNHHDGLVDVIETHGVFRDGAFVSLDLPDGPSVPREQMAAFFKDSKVVKLRNTNNPKLFYTSNLAEKADDVYARYYVAGDPVLNDLKKALNQQIGRINIGQAMNQITDMEWVDAAKSGFRMLFAVEGVCTKTPKQWCDLVKIYQQKISDRREDIFPRVMVPHLIALAEESHKALHGSQDAVRQLAQLQKELEELRGSPLGADLVMEVSQRAAKASDLRKTAISGDSSTKREQNLAEGRYFQAAVAAYETILKEARQVKEDVAARTGYTEARLLAFPWTGNFHQDATKAKQSRRGFTAATHTVVNDVSKIKGSAPDMLNETDIKALRILAEVAYPNRAALDEANSAAVDDPGDPVTAPLPEALPVNPEPGSPYFTWYKDALEKVKALYAKAQDLQKLVGKGAFIVPPGAEMTERVPGVFEARISSPELRGLLTDGKVLIAWESDQQGAAFANPDSLKTAFTPVEVGEVAVQAVFSMKSDPAIQATLKTKIPVRAGQKPSVLLNLAPNPPAPGKTAWATAVPDSKSRGLALEYAWSCDNCGLVAEKGARALVKAPETGAATVGVRMKAKGGEQLAETSLVFDAGSGKGAKPAPDKGDKPLPPDQPPGSKGKPDDTASAGDAKPGADKGSGADAKDPSSGLAPKDPQPATGDQGATQAPGRPDSTRDPGGSQGQAGGTGPSGAQGVQGPAGLPGQGFIPGQGLVPGLGGPSASAPGAAGSAQTADAAKTQPSGQLSSRGVPLITRQVVGQVRADQPFAVKAVLPPEIAAKAVRYHWFGPPMVNPALKGDTKEPQAEFFGLPWGSYGAAGWNWPQSFRLDIEAYDEKNQLIAEYNNVYDQISQTPLKIKAALPASWKTSPNDFGLSGSREAGERGFSNARGSISVSFKDTKDVENMEAIKKMATLFCNSQNQTSQANKSPGTRRSASQVQEVEIAGFKGYQCLRTFETTFENSERRSLSGQARGYVMKGAAVIHFDIQVSGDAYRPDKKDFIATEATAMWQEAMAALKSITVGTEGGLSTAASAAPSSVAGTAPGTEPPKDAPLSVSLSGDKTQLAVGESVKVTAAATGGTPPYAYGWTGPVQGAGNTVSAEATAAMDKLAIGVEVKDAKGATARANLDVPVGRITVELTQKAPAGSEVATGAQVSLSARLSSNGKPVKAEDYVLRWEPSTEARFAKAEGPGVTENTATVVRPGKLKVWVVALRRQGTTLATVGESNQIELNVGGSNISLSAAPAEPLVGQEVTVTAVETPKIADAEAAYWWDDSQGGAGTGPTANQRQWKITVKEAKPVTVNAMLKSKNGGAELARQSLTITPKSYQVTAVNLGHAWGGETTKPVVWKPGTGLVTLDKEIAAGMDVGLRADIAPAPPAPQSLRYKWSVNEGSSLTGGPASKETRVQRASKGSIEATVEVRDDKNALLGSNTVSVPVTYSDEDVKQGKSKSQELDKLKQEAARHWADGELDQACDKAKAAALIEPKYPEAKTWCEGRERILALVKDGQAALDKHDPAAAQAKLDEGLRINAKAKALAELKDKIKDAREKKDAGDKDLKAKVDALLAQAGRKWSEGEAEGAREDAAEAHKLDPKHEQAARDQSRYADGLTKLTASLNRAREFEAKDASELAMAAVKTGKEVNASYKPLLELEKKLSERKQKKQELTRLLSEAKKAWEAGDLDLACQSAQAAILADLASEEAKKLSGSYCPARDAVNLAVKQGEVELADGRLEKARVQLDAGRKVHPKAKALAGLEDKIKKAKAGDQAQAAPGAQRDQAAINRLVAQAASQWKAGEAEAAVTSLKEAARLDPNDEKIRQELQTRTKDLEKLKRAVSEGKSALEKNDVNKAKASVAEGKAVNALYKPLAALEADIAKAGKPQAPATPEAKAQCEELFNKGGAAFNSGDAAKARDLFIRSAKECGSCAANFNAGVALAKLGDYASAKTWFQARAKCAPNDADAQRQIQEMDKLLAKKPTGPAPAPAQAPAAASPGQPPASGASGVNVAGSWTSTEGALSMTQNGSSVSGSYTTQSGKLTGTLKGKTLEGVWTQASSGRRCAQEKNGSAYWGRIRFVFEDERFTGVWGYCDDEPKSNWSGQRNKGAAPAPAPAAARAPAPGPAPAQAAVASPLAAFNGSYVGLFAGGSQGNVTVSVRDGGVVTGTVSNQNINGTLTGKVDAQGNIVCQLGGTHYGKPMSGTVKGKIAGVQIQGDWAATSNGYQQAGTWNAKKK